MKRNRSSFKKYATILTLVILASVFLSAALFAKGVVIGYVWGDNFLGNDQLERFTHVMVSDLYMDANGTVFPNPELVQNKPNWASSWQDDLAVRSHTKSVKISIVIAEGTSCRNLSSVTADNTKHASLVDTIVGFVNDYVGCKRRERGGQSC